VRARQPASRRNPGAYRRVAARPGRPRLGYLLKAFPRVSETFIINEIIALERQGFDLHIYSMIHTRDRMRHRLVDQVRSPVTHLPDPLWRSLLTVVGAHLWMLRRAPGRYVSTLLRVLALVELDLLERFVQAPCLARLLERDDIGHVHAGFVHAPGSLAWLVFLLTGTPFSVATHAKDLYHSPPRVLRRKLADARVVFTCTRYNVDHLERLCGPAGFRLRQVYHGTDLRRFRFGPCALASPPLVLSVARLVEKKGLDDLIRACAVLRDRGRSFQCRIIGGGVLRPRLEELVCELGLEGRVTFQGALDQEEVIAAYPQAAVMVLPCIVTSDGDRDGIPNVLVEAAACGVPIVSTRVSGVPELITHGQTGLLVPPHNPAALAESVDAVLQSPSLRERVRANARTRVEEEFDVDRNARRVGQELRDLVAVTRLTGWPPSRRRAAANQESR
jgi:glycosyltransferase involved in cell wall biosynthesis